MMVRNKMPRWFFMALAIFGMIFLAAQTGVWAQPNSLVGATAPKIRGSSVDGSRIDAPVSGNVTLIVFWNSRYRLSTDALSGVQRVFDRLRNRGIACLGVNDSGEDQRTVVSVASGLGVSYPLITGSVGSGAAAAYKLRGVPVVFVVNRSGMVTAVFEGWDRSTEGEIERKASTLL